MLTSLASPPPVVQSPKVPTSTTNAHAEKRRMEQEAEEKKIAELRRI